MEYGKATKHVTTGPTAWDIVTSTPPSFVSTHTHTHTHTQAGTEEVAVKVVRKEFFKQDPKVRENLDREIRILKLLRGCEYVVHLHHVQVGGWIWMVK